MARRKLKSTKFPAIVTSQKPDQPSVVEPAAKKVTDDEIVQILEGYRTEAEYARLAGPSSRDMVWLQHLDLYWNRFDFSKKAAWQAREVMPEFPQYIDRFAAAMRVALSSGQWFSITAAGDEDQDLARVIRKLMTFVLGRIGRSPTGHPTDFMSFFEEAMKMGALAMTTALVTYKSDGEGGGYVAADLEDPYNVWLDPTGRGLYRIRRVEMELHELLALGDLKDGDGEDLYDNEAITSSYASIVALMRAEREKRTGTGQWATSNRRPVVLHEYIATLITPDGEVLGRDVLCVVANNRFLIRGPEENPFWHGEDWMLTAPIITVPLSPYGRSYAENFATIARTFNEMTNMLLDAVMTSSIKAFAAVPGLLEDPSQLEEGIYPNVLFRLIEGQRPEEFLTAVEMGTLPAEAFQIWQALKKELQEGAAFNEMTLGQSAPKGRTSATEVNTVDTNATSYIRSIASNIESNFLEPFLNIVWKTTVQHLDPKDTELADAVGPDWYKALCKNKKELATYKVKFSCKGISSLLLKKQKLQDFLQFLQTIAQNQELTQWFLQEFTPQRVGAYLADLMDVELDRLEPTPREKMQQELQQQQQLQQQQAMQQQELQAKGQQDAAKAAAQPGEDARADKRAFQAHAQKAILSHLLSRVGGGAPGGGPTGPGAQPGGGAAPAKPAQGGPPA